MITVNIDEKSIDRFIFKLEKRIESYTEAVDSTMDFAREIILARVETGNMSDGRFRVSKSKKKFGRYESSYGKYQRKPAGLPTSKVTLKFTGNMFKNFLINKGSRINVKNRLYRRSLYFSNNKAVRANGTRSTLSYRELADVHDEKFGGLNYNASMAQGKQILNYFKNKIKTLP